MYYDNTETLFGYDLEEYDNYEEQDEVEELMDKYNLHLTEEQEREVNEFNPMLQRHKK